MKKAGILLFFIISVWGLYSQDNKTTVRERGYCNRLSSSFDPAFAPFYHGVASGDAFDDRVILWTRVTPDDTYEEIPVDWFVALDTSFNQIVSSGTEYTTEELDWTIKIDVDGLQPGVWYYYYFHALDRNSIIGRTKTTPVGDFDSLRIAVVSGSNYNNGYFNVYRALAERNDIDCVIHLGDYIYEYGTNEYGTHEDRSLQPAHEILSLSDYRMRYSHYRLDPDLIYAHQQYPWYVIYDDHETANNSYVDGAENHDPNTEGDWETRKNNGLQAYFEWIPMRRMNDSEDPDNIIRHTIRFGNLATSMLLDTRLEARDNPEDLGVNDPNKRLIGDQQFNWLKMELYNYQYTDLVQWKLITQQIMFAPLTVFGIVANKDQWDGYNFERQRILNWIYGMDIKNTVVLSGDIHTSWANDVPNPNMGDYGSNGQGSGTVEFVTPSVTSPSTNDFLGGLGSGALMGVNPHMKWINLADRGYYILDVNQLRCQADWYFINTINETNYVLSHASSWFVNNNENFLRQASIPSIRLNPNPPLAPEYPNQTVDIENVESKIDVVVVGVYPNPVDESFTLQFYVRNAQKVQLKITNLLGKTFIEKTMNITCPDLQYQYFDASAFKPGNYLLTIITEDGVSTTKQIIKE
jgi:alkaline phosphatase D